MDEKNFFETIAKMFNKNPETVTAATTIKGDLGANSQMLFGVCAMIEQIFGKSISYAALNNCNTLEDVLACLK